MGNIPTVTLAIPPTRSLKDLAHNLRLELIGSQDIKDLERRDNYITILNSLLGKVISLQQVPENGIILRAGNPTDAKALEVITPNTPVEQEKFIVEEPE